LSVTEKNKKNLGKKMFSGISKEAFILGLSFFCANISAVMAFTSVPLFMSGFLNSNMQVIGRLEASVEVLSLIMRSISGSISDFLGKRKIFIVLGYGFYCLSRILLVGAQSIGVVAAARILDKVGNGIQASPREALIGDMSQGENVGSNYGINKALGFLGSVIGTLFIGLLIWKINDFYRIFQITCIPMFIALFLAFLVKDHTPRDKGESVVCPTPHLTLVKKNFFLRMYKDLKCFPVGYWKTLLVVFLFKLGYFSGAFLIVFFKKIAFEHMPWPLSIFQSNPNMAGPFVMLVQNYFCAFLSFPLGRLSDRFDRRLIVGFGFMMLMLSVALLGFVHHWFWIAVAIACYGIQMSIQGALLALLSDTMPVHLRGTGFGLFYLISGVAVFLSNEFVGSMWETFSPWTPFRFLIIPMILGLMALLWLKSKEISFVKHQMDQ
jgi:MFS family permease